MILLIDNYDSFVYNLARYFEQLGQAVRIVRNTAIRPDDVIAMAPDAIVFSPGPRAPDQAGNSLEIVRRLYAQLPMLGVCLGHQTIVAAFGGRIVRAEHPMHGRASPIHHYGDGIFAGLPNPLQGGRYHSLVVEKASLPDCLEATAHAADGTIMAVRHRSLPIVGLQFHPESILTEHGYSLLAAFLRMAGLPTIGMEQSQPSLFVE
jgi:anthranilate synthase/aminodeoxychorismate synthase-like glutamine amidotransferase